MEFKFGNSRLTYLRAYIRNAAMIVRNDQYASYKPISRSIRGQTFLKMHLFYLFSSLPFFTILNKVVKITSAWHHHYPQTINDHLKNARNERFPLCFQISSESQPECKDD